MQGGTPSVVPCGIAPELPQNCPRLRAGFRACFNPSQLNFASQCETSLNCRGVFVGGRRLQQNMVLPRFFRGYFLAPPCAGLPNITRTPPTVHSTLPPRGGGAEWLPGMLPSRPAPLPLWGGDLQGTSPQVGMKCAPNGYQECYHRGLRRYQKY